MKKLLQDVRFAIRAMQRNPGLVLAAVLSLGLGIGANTAIFSLLDAVILKSLPVRNPERLFLFGHGRWDGSQDTLPNKSWDLFSYSFYREISEKTQVFSGIAAIDSIEFNTHGSVSGGALEAMNADLVSGTYFRVLGVSPMLGRLLMESDDQAAGTGPVAVASYSWWERRFGKNPFVLGKTVRIQSTVYTIVGVAP